MSSVIKSFQDSIEFLTVQSTGESGMSLTGIARLCGVKRQSVTDIIASVESGTVQSSGLANWVGKPLELPVRGENNERILKDRFCAALIDYYAFDSKQISQESRDQAIFAQRRFAEMGVRAWIQGITGWKEPSTSLTVDDFVLKEPLRWTDVPRPFPPEFYRQIYRLRGWDYENADRRGHPGCVGTWTNQFVYDRFPDGVPERITDGYKANNKKFRKYEFLTPEEGRRHLEKHMAAVLATMRVTPDGNWTRFLKSLDKAIPDARAIQSIQLELSFLSELEDQYDGVDNYLDS